MSANALAQDVVGHLRSEVDHLEEEKAILLRERESLLRHDLEGLLDCLKEKEALRSKGRILEEACKLLRERVGETVEPEEEGRRGLLEAMMAHTEEPHRSRIRLLRSRLLDLIQQVEGLREGNAYLIRSALGRVGRSMEFLQGLQGATVGTYDGRGRPRAPGASSPRLRQQA